MASMAAKNNHAASCQAENRGHFRIPRALDTKVKLGTVPLEVIQQKLLLRDHPIIQVGAMQAATLLEKLVSTFSYCRLNNLPVLFIFALNRNHPIVAALSSVSVHSLPLSLHL
jgi:hypothetical protein